MNITVAIPTYNRAGDLRKTLASLAEMSPGDGEFELLVIGNRCTDSTADVVASAAPNFAGCLRYVEEPRQGLNCSRNRALAEAKYEVVAFLDDDVDVSPSWLVAIMRADRDMTAAGDDWAVIGGRALLAYPCKRPTWLAESAEGLLSKLDCGTERRLATADEVFGLNMILRREWVERVGGFRPDLDRVGKCLISGGDTDLVRRIADAGGRLVYEPAAFLAHRVAPERLRRRWFWARVYWGRRGEVRMWEAKGISVDSMARSAWRLVRAVRTASLTLVTRGPRSWEFFESTNKVVARWGDLVGICVRWMWREAPPRGPTAGIPMNQTVSVP